MISVSVLRTNLVTFVTLFLIVAVSSDINAQSTGKPSFVPEIDLTAEERVWLKEHPVIRISNETDWPPFDFVEDGQPAGYSIDYLNLLERRLPGVRFEYINGYKWSELVEMLKNREIDVLHVSAVLESRKSFALFTVHILICSLSL